MALHTSEVDCIGVTPGVKAPGVKEGCGKSTSIPQYTPFEFAGKHRRSAPLVTGNAATSTTS